MVTAQPTTKDETQLTGADLATRVEALLPGVAERAAEASSGEMA